MTWRVSGNLLTIADSIREHLGTVTIFFIGDAAHQAEVSDHNPDSRGIVCAADVMYEVGPNATEVVKACIGRPDLTYVIHNHTIWSASHGWVGRDYTGSNPHTDHVHISTAHTTEADQDRTPLHWEDEDMANSDEILTFLQRAFNGFSDPGTPHANLVGPWIAGLQTSIANLIEKVDKLQADVDQLKTSGVPTHITGHITGEVS